MGNMFENMSGYKFLGVEHEGGRYGTDYAADTI